MLKLILFSITLTILSCANIQDNKSDSASNTSNKSKIKTTHNYILDTNRLEQKAKEALEYCKKHKMNISYSVLIDMDIHSGRNRIFLWNFKTNSIQIQGLASHGCGAHSWSMDETKTNPDFSNVSDSHLSSLGKFKIGKRGWSNWGIHVNYKLHGLENTNNNAYK